MRGEWFWRCLVIAWLTQCAIALGLIVAATVN
jgi:hypothetical protein